ncbi:ribosome-binding factor A [Natranaerovirga pectinivora]|uniref:Ribosome-binding factor A n=1 Tax=Natranaerovirga pectinivora TaxID=682400 RepID=A0A4R3MNT1_9FIRM|nr:30S ribosome-binding factor RbfA [Natranaerovirga pectinivora]TCT15050.1 ribosome-binding factor A [Natranaerovirga pectinivora]
MKKTSSRMIRINEEIKKELSSIIQNQLKDPRIHLMTSVVDVNTTSDLKHCKVFISVLGNETEQNDSIKGLNSASSFIRTEIAKRINLRNTPEIKFVNDDSIERSVYMSKLIDDLNKKSE